MIIALHPLQLPTARLEELGYEAVFCHETGPGGHCIRTSGRGVSGGASGTLAGADELMTIRNGSGSV